MAIRNRRILASLVFLVAFAFVASAASDDLVIKPRTYKALEEAKEDLGRLQKFVEKHASESHAVVLALQMQAHLYMQKGDYPNATTAYRRALGQDSLASDIKNRLHLDLARSLVVQERYADALPHLTTALDVPEIQSKVDAMLLLGRSHIALQNYAKAQVWLEKGIASSATPEEGWYELLLLSYHQQDKYQEMVKLLPKVVRRFPAKDNYWQQWAGALMHLDRFTEASAVLEMAYLQGTLVQESHILQLAALMRQSGIPARAAELLEGALQKQQIASDVKNWELVADTWQQAREALKAQKALQKAITIGGDTRLRRKLVRFAIEDEDWKSCTNFSEPLRRRTTGAERAEVSLELGYCAYYAGNMQLAQDAFQEARQNESTRKAAVEWLGLLQ